MKTVNKQFYYSFINKQNHKYARKWYTDHSLENFGHLAEKLHKMDFNFIRHYYIKIYLHKSDSYFLPIGDT